MTDTESAKLAAETAAKLKSLELLFDYTKFHIGVYLAVAGSYITISTIKVGETLLLRLKTVWLWLAMVSFMIAGLSGGVIASTLTQCVGGGEMACESSVHFLDQSIGIPWSLEWISFSGRTWTYIEHTSFWIGLVSAVVSFGGARRRP
jgi:hypothetical protein